MTLFFSILKTTLCIIALVIFVMTPIQAANKEVQIGVPFVSKDALKQSIRLLFGGRVDDKNIFIISQKQDYLEGIKSGKFDAFFAKANIGSWAIAQHSYEAVAKLREPLFLRLIARNDRIDVFEFNDLDYRAICTEGSPDVSFHFLQSLLDKPESLSEKIITFPQQNIDHIFERNCVGAMVNESRLKSSNESKHYTTLARSKKLSQIGFFIKKDINRDVRNHLINKLFSIQAKAFVTDLKNHFSTPSDELVKAKNSDYPFSSMKHLPAEWKLHYLDSLLINGPTVNP